MVQSAMAFVRWSQLGVKVASSWAEDEAEKAWDVLDVEYSFGKVTVRQPDRGAEVVNAASVVIIIVVVGAIVVSTIVVVGSIVVGAIVVVVVVVGGGGFSI